MSTSLVCVMLFIDLIICAFPKGSPASKKPPPPQSISLGDVTTLTFHKDQMTTGRRIAPTRQLICIGGEASSMRDEVRQVKCTNKGFNGEEYEWDCVPLFSSSGLGLGKYEVVCEGYFSRDDSNILAGSCSLEFTLEYVEGATLPKGSLPTNHTHKNRSISNETRDGVSGDEENEEEVYWNKVDQFLFFVIVVTLVVGVIWSAMNIYLGPRARSYQDRGELPTTTTKPMKNYHRDESPEKKKKNRTKRYSSSSSSSDGEGGGGWENAASWNNTTKKRHPKY